MSVLFQQSTRALKADMNRGSAWALAGAVLLISGVVAWALCARVSVVELADRARIQTSAGVHVVQTPVGGRLLTYEMRLGHDVEAGTILAQLDAGSEALELQRGMAVAEGLPAQISAMRRQLDAAQRALTEEAAEHPSVLGEAEQGLEGARAAAAHAAHELRRFESLRSEGIVSDERLAQARADATTARATARLLAASLERVNFSSRAKTTDREGTVAKLEQELAELENVARTTAAGNASVSHSIELRTIRAPVAGRIAQVVDWNMGTVLAEGSRLGAIVPTGELEAVAALPAARALGRVKPGQRAWMRLDGFPWTEYGKVAARVVRVGSEPLDGNLRVDLSLDRASSIPLEHGLSGNLEIEVESVSPAVLLGRLVVARFTGNTPAWSE